MKLSIYSIFDSKARAFLPPFYLANDSLATRVFSDCANDSVHAFGKHPEDYSLFRLGEFDDALGTFDLLSTHVNLGLAASFVEDI